MVTKNLTLPAVALVAFAMALLIWPSPDTPDTIQSPVLITDVADGKADLTPDVRLETKVVVDDVVAVSSVDSQVDVTGRVIDHLSQNISGVQIEISAKNTTSSQQGIHTATTGASGEFIIRAVVPGNEYRLEALGSGAYAGLVMDSLQVKNNMEAVTITLDTIDLVSVDGMIVNVDNSPVPDFEILVRNTGMAYPGSKIVSDSSGFFHLNEFPAGELQLSTDGDDHFKISGISLTPGEYQNLTVMIDQGGYHLSGWVSDDFGAPILQARVVMTTSFTHEGIESFSYRFRLTDKNGNFEFTELGGQEHKLVVDATGYQSLTQTYHFQSFSDELRVELKRLHDEN